MRHGRLSNHVCQGKEGNGELLIPVSSLEEKGIWEKMLENLSLMPVTAGYIPTPQEQEVEIRKWGEQKGA